ncbi:MAG: dockerin type I repeat-containing protein [Planctomycetota bacterium]
MLSRWLALVALGSWAGVASGGDAGLVPVIGEAPQAVEFTLPALSAYKFDYDPARIALWDSVSMQSLIPPGSEFTAPGLAGDFDMDVDIDLRDFAFFQICFTGDGGGPLGSGCQTFDFDSDTDVDLADFRGFLGVFTGPPQVTGDATGDGVVDLLDYRVLAGCLGGPAQATPGSCQATDLDEDGDVDLEDFAFFQRVFGNMQEAPPVTLTVFVEGLTASVALGDAVITLLDDPDDNGVFEVEATQTVTVVSINIAPSSGPPGTPLTVTLQPAIAPLAFDSATTADWVGVYQPPVGPPTAPFQIAYSAAQFRESSPGQAVLVVGDGTVTNPPDFANLEGPGTTPGTFTFHLTALTLQRTFAFAPELGNAAIWESIDYVFNPNTGMMDPPVLAGHPDHLDMILLSVTRPDPLHVSESILLVSYTYHLAAVLRIDENPTTAADAPATVLLDLVSYATGGTELDRVQDVVLTKVTGDDGDPEHIVYHSNLETPIIFVDVPLNKANYPSVILLQTEAGGSVVIVAAVD